MMQPDTPVSKRTRAVLLLINTALFAYFTVSFLKQTDHTFAQPVLAAIGAAINGFYFLLVAVETLYLYRKNRSLQIKLTLVWLIGLGMLAPLLVTTEAGYRLVFSVNVMVNLFILMVLQDILVSVPSKYERAIKYPIFAGTIIAVLVLTFVYTKIDACNDARLDIFKQAAATNASEVVLPKFPYKNYLHAPDPTDERKLYLFKVFYGIDTDTNIVIESAQ